jgi:pyruvate-ferredoxin/flavodoxin oxidoreductase
MNLFTSRDKNIIKERNIKVYIVNATKISYEVGLDNKINTIIETIIFKLGKIIPFNFAIKELKNNLEVMFTNKGQDVIDKNIKAVDRALESLEEIDLENINVNTNKAPKKDLFEIIDLHTVEIKRVY